MWRIFMWIRQMKLKIRVWKYKDAVTRKYKYYAVILLYIYGNIFSATICVLARKVTRGASGTWPYIEIRRIRRISSPPATGSLCFRPWDCSNVTDQWIIVKKKTKYLIWHYMFQEKRRRRANTFRRGIKLVSNKTN